MGDRITSLASLDGRGQPFADIFADRIYSFVKNKSDDLQIRNFIGTKQVRAENFYPDNTIPPRMEGAWWRRRRHGSEAYPRTAGNGGLIKKRGQNRLLLLFLPENPDRNFASNS